MEISERSEQNSNIPQLISQEKYLQLRKNSILTIFGLSQNVTSSIINIIIWLCMSTTIIILGIFVNTYLIAVLVPIGVNLFLTGLINLINKKQFKIHKYILTAIFSFLWASHLNNTKQIGVYILSSISIAFSVSTIMIQPIKEFVSASPYYKQFNIHSVRYVRFLVVFPILLSEVIIDLASNIDIQNNGAQNSYYLALRYASSLVFLTWTFGWLSTIYNTFYFILSTFNRFILGDEVKCTFFANLASFLFALIPFRIYYIFTLDSLNLYYILWLGATLTSIVTFLITIKKNLHLNTMNNPEQIKDNLKVAPNIEIQNTNQKVKTCAFRRILLSILLELVICFTLTVIMIVLESDLQNVNPKSVMIVDVVLYATFVMINWLKVPRNSLGMTFNVKFLNTWQMRFIQRTTLRIISGITIIIMVYTMDLTLLQKYLNVSSIAIQYVFVPILVYRTFKRIISSSTTFSLHFSIFLGLLIMTNNPTSIQAVLIVLFMPPFPSNPYMILIAPFVTPKKLSHKKQILYIMVYLIITLLLAHMFVISLGLLQFSMIFGLPTFYCILPTIQEKQQSKIKSSQYSLYQKILQYLPQQIFMFRQQGFYLLRISKYIILTEVKQQLYGFSQMLDIKGLQVQEVTSCHSREGETIDKLVQQNWGENQSNRSFFNPFHLTTVLSPIDKYTINVPTQNQIQLTGIIQSSEFVKMFKQTSLKAFIYFLSKQQFTQTQLKQGEDIIFQLNAIYKQQKANQIFPFKFSQSVNFNAKYPSYPLQPPKKKLPPIKSKNQKFTTGNDLLQLLGSDFNASNIKQEPSTHNLIGQNSPTKQTFFLNDEIKQEQKQIKISKQELNLSLVLTLYHYTVGKFDYVNIQKLYSLIKKDIQALPQVTFIDSLNIVAKSLGAAFKIAIDKITLGQNQVQLIDFQEYQKNAFLGITGTQQFNQAVSSNLEDIWTLNYAKGKLSINRLAKAQNDLYMFKVDECILKSVWNNLKFQLIFAGNDNDERYSIQTHANLLRNLWVQACDEPFGYPSYHTGPIVNN